VWICTSRVGIKADGTSPSTALMLACDRFLAQLVLNNILLKVSSFSPFSGDISSCRAPVRLCSGLHTWAYVD
jgi:hypothetical protein